MTWFYVVVAVLWVIATPIAWSRLAKQYRRRELSRRFLVSQLLLWLAVAFLIANGFLRSIALTTIYLICLGASAWLMLKSPAR